MQVEFLEEGSDDCPLIRIYGVNAAEFTSLLHAAQDQAVAEGKTCAIHQLPGFHAINLVLSMVSAPRDEGVCRTEPASFVWALTPAKWRIVASLIEPFALSPQDGTHQWLSGREARHGLGLGSISVLLSCSRDGRW